MHRHWCRRASDCGARGRSYLSLVRLPTDADAAHCRTSFRVASVSASPSRAHLSIQPDVLIADEIVSALDVSVQAQILNLLLDMQERLGLAMLFVSHDLRVVRHLAHQVAVMYLGRVVEYGPADRVFADPQHPYTQALLRAAPTLQTGRRSTESALRGELPSPMQEVPGCPFHPRCPKAFDRCAAEVPRMHMRHGHGGVCHLLDPPADRND